MARTALTVQSVVITGLEPTLTAGDATNNHEFLNTGDCFVRITNGGGVGITATFQTPSTAGGLAIADPAIAIAAGEERVIGPFPPAYFNQTGGLVYLDLDTAATVTVSVMKL